MNGVAKPMLIAIVMIIIFQMWGPGLAKKSNGLKLAELIVNVNRTADLIIIIIIISCRNIQT
jgi:hypothetical protein